MMLLFFFFFFKQKTAYEMRISDWSSDVCSSDLADLRPFGQLACDFEERVRRHRRGARRFDLGRDRFDHLQVEVGRHQFELARRVGFDQDVREDRDRVAPFDHRSEEHTSELQSLMRISYAVFCLKKKTITSTT